MLRFSPNAIGFVLALALICVAGDGLAKKKKQKQLGLGEVVVRVLDAAGSPVGGVEVLLDVEREDGSSDRRLGTSGEDGDARFSDVRLNCTQVSATVRIEGREIVGKPRPCSPGRVEAFVVLPVASVEEPLAAPTDSAPEETQPSPPLVDEDPYAEPETEVEPEPEAEAVLDDGDGPQAPEDGPFELRARIGPDFCVAWFYEAGENQRTCDDSDPIGLGLEVDASLHFEEWFLVGVIAGYRYFGAERYPPPDVAEDTSSLQSTQNHTLLLGFQMRASVMLERFVLALDFVPVGIAHQWIVFKDDTLSTNEFFVALGPSFAFRVGEATWIGAYIELIQPMPWVRSEVFRPGAISAGLQIGGRFTSAGSE